ncbi:MAG TPA: exonuclease domain-containing protein [Burkholderiales bacterium]|nr:exonuclease domain-containing protein [Burkholderiales bacterium]
MQLLDAPLAIVDLETTGANAAWDRITEIAVIELERGEITGEWSTLVNPDTPIPPAIQALTGITDAMVAHAPRFAALAEGLHERLAGRVLVAHNARFDYGFLRQEFERAGLKYSARTLCTVRLSRRLYPEHARHNLDSLIARHGLRCGARHRAQGDAQALWQFLRVAAAERGAEALAAAAQQILKQPTLPPHIDRALVDAIPQAPGVYLFYGEGGAPLYVGKSVALRSRVLAHFSDDLRSAKDMQLAREVRRIEWQRSAGELGALLREAELVKSLAPVFNRRLRRPHGLCGFVLEPPREPPARALRLAEADELDPALLPDVRGVFRSRRAALAALRALADEHRLCLQALGLEKAGAGKRPCFRFQIGRCAGACAGHESPQAHHARLAHALARLPAITWPYRGAIGVIEEDPGREMTQMHLVHHWCYLGTASSEAELAELLEGSARPRFDLDQYRILARHLGARRARVVELGPRAARALAA